MPERVWSGKPLATTIPGDTGHTAGEKEDRYGEWLADDARIWRVYERLAKLDDDEKVKRWSGGLNNLALFATLFAGITTAFIIESQGDLKPDFAELAYRVQNATAHGRPYVEEPFVVPGQARTVNCLWIASLLLSLSAALIAVMGQDWVEMYVDKPICNPRQWAEIRSFRLGGVRRWYMPGVIATAPVLLHASLFLFGIGLAVFMAPDAITQNLCIALSAIVASLYAVMMFSPVLWSSSPFRSPATMLLRRWFCARFQRRGTKDSSQKENTTRRYIAALRGWIQNIVFTSPHDREGRDALPYSAAVYDSETDSFVAVSSRFQKVHSWFQTAVNSILARCYPIISDRLTAVCRWLCATFSDVSNRFAIHGWTRRFVAPFQTASAQFPAGHGSSVFGDWARALRRWHVIGFSRNSDGGDALPYNAAVYDAETATFVVAPAWLQKVLTRSQTMFNRMITRFVRPALCWLWNCYTNFRTSFGHILDNSRPDFSTGWSAISLEPSAAPVTESLNWLSSASSSPEVTQLVIAGLCDHVIGTEVAKHANARSLTEKLWEYAENHWEHMSMLDLSRYVIISGNAGWSDWPLRVAQRFERIIDAETPISQDFLLALVYLTRGFRFEPLDLPRYYSLDSLTIRLARFERLCARIPDRSPITLTAVTTVVAQMRLDPKGDLAALMTLCLLMNKWRDDLPTDLRPVERVLRGMLTRCRQLLEQTNKLTALCEPSLNRPIDNILHLVIALFTQCCKEDISGQSLLQLALSLARAASVATRAHSCLAAVFGNSDPRITRAAWTALPAHDIESALGLTNPNYHLGWCPAELPPMLARMIARCIWLPFPVLTGKISPQTPLSWGWLLLDWAAMSRKRALPDDLFRPTLECGALANLAAYMREAPADMTRGKHLLYTIGAIALWVKTRRDVEDRQRLFNLFSRSETTRVSDSAVWDLVDAIGSALESAGYPISRVLPYLPTFHWAVRGFMFAMKALQEIFPGPKCTLWADIALKVGACRHYHPVVWWHMKKAIRDGTGWDFEHFAKENPSRGTGTTVMRAESSVRGSSFAAIVRASAGAGGDAQAHPASRIAWSEIGRIAEGGP